MGRAMAVALANAGARVVATAARSQDELDDLGREIAAAAGADRLLAPKSDVPHEDQCLAAVAQAIDRFGVVPVLFTNAARRPNVLLAARPAHPTGGGGPRSTQGATREQPMEFWNGD